MSGPCSVTSRPSIRTCESSSRRGLPSVAVVSPCAHVVLKGRVLAGMDEELGNNERRLVHVEHDQPLSVSFILWGWCVLTNTFFLPDANYLLKCVQGFKNKGFTVYGISIQVCFP